MLYALLLAAAQPAAPAGAVPPDVLDLSRAQTAWLICLEPAAQRRGGGRATAQSIEAAYADCAGEEAALRAGVARSFAAGEAEAAIQDANGAWAACLGTRLLEGHASRAGRSDDALVDAAFAGCGPQEQAFRRLLAGRMEPAAIDVAIDSVRAQMHAEAPRLLATLPR